MKQIIIKTQEEFDKIQRVGKDEEVIFKADKIRINCVLEVFGILRLSGEIDCSWNENRYIVARGNSSPSIEARGGVVRVLTDIVKPIILHGFAVLVAPINLKLTIKKDRNCLVQRIKPQKYLIREGIKVKKEKVILFKKVSKDYKTQEGTENETLWQIGSTVTHPCWNPKNSECGEGKFHACSRPYFCDEFRNERDDKYIAVKIATKDLYEWKNPQYPHKIAFRCGKVLYEVDKYGKQTKKGKKNG